MSVQIKKTYNPSCCRLLWDFTDRNQYHNWANPQNRLSAEEDPLDNSSGKEHPYMYILPGVPLQSMLVLPTRIWLRCTYRGIFLAHAHMPERSFKLLSYLHFNTIPGQ